MDMWSTVVSDVPRDAAAGVALRPVPLIIGPCPPTRLACSAAAHVVRDSLKWKAKDADAVDVLHSAAPELIAVYQALQGRPDGVPGERRAPAVQRHGACPGSPARLPGVLPGVLPGRVCWLKQRL